MKWCYRSEGVAVSAWLEILLVMIISLLSCSASMSIRSTIVSEDVDEYKILYYPQTLDHFNYQPLSFSKFNHKYAVNYKYWGGANASAPILVYLGDESPLLNSTLTGLILKDYALHFKALLVLIEHRFYGESKPFGMLMEEILKNTSVRGYFNSAQAIADYAEVILHIKRKLNTTYSPVIVFGGSYGGMLASWFRLKYPHVALGALASSAPVRYFDRIIPPNHGYFSIITKDFQEISDYCYRTIRKSWAEIDKVGSKPNGLSILSKKFNTCVQLKSTSELKDFLQHVYEFAAQYNVPSITSLCDAINNGSKGKDILSRVYSGVVGTDSSQCLSLNWEATLSNDTILGWDWQDMKLILQRFGSNIIFSNGLKDPYSSGSVLENLSDSVIAIYTANGTHTMDLGIAQKDDPKWLIRQRRHEVEIMNGWIHKYYSDIDYLGHY